MEASGGGCGAGIVTGSARGIAGGHPPRCGSEGLKCSRAANAQTWRVLRLNTAERHPELAPTDDIAVTARARAGGRVRRAGEFRGRCERESRDPTDSARSAGCEIFVPRTIAWQSEKIHSGNLHPRSRMGIVPAGRARLFSGMEIPGFGFWRCAGDFCGWRGASISLNRADHHARRAGDLDSVARPRVRDASQEEGR